LSHQTLDDVWRRINIAAAVIYLPNSRCINQPSNPDAASGRTEVRVGVGRPVVPASEGALAGVLDGAAACATLENAPPACEPGSGTAARP
jgi:hypothetical protein